MSPRSDGGAKLLGPYELLAEGARLDVISGQLGHGSLATTHRYLAHIAPHERVAAVRRRSAWLSS